MGIDYQTPIGNDYLELRAELGTALFALIRLATESHAPPATVQTLQSLQAGLKEPFLFVVAGEVKAGKSSLLNALFGRDFCRVDVLPATDRVNVFKYGEQAHDVSVTPSLIERYQPVNFLKDFNIVDTPGTNTIVADHQTITEQFVPQADLIIFVFSVVNPWGASAWQFLELLQKRWLKNVIFVLQQMDLRDAAEIEVVSQHLRQTAMQRFGQAFPIFPVSAKKAFLSKTSGVDKDRLWSESHFAPLEDYINETVGTGESRRGKLKSVAQTSQVVLKELADQARGSQQIIAADREQLARLKAMMANMHQRSNLQVQGFLRGIDTAYARVEGKGEQILRDKLKLWQSMKRVFNRDSQWQVEFQRDLETMLRDAITKQMEHALGLLENELKNVWTVLYESLQTNFAPDTRKQFDAGATDFAEQRTRLFERIQMAMLENMGDDHIQKLLHEMFAGQTAWASVPVGGAVGGTVLAALAAKVATLAVFDVTGVTAAVVVAFGVVMVNANAKRVIKAYHAQMAAKREELTHAIEDLITQAIDVFYQKAAQVYHPLESFCDVQEQRYGPLLGQVENLEKTFAKIAARL